MLRPLDLLLNLTEGFDLLTFFLTSRFPHRMLRPLDLLLNLAILRRKRVIFRIIIIILPIKNFDVQQILVLTSF
jgi:hypothetical protein